MSWIVPGGWIDHLMNALHESGLQGGMEVVEGTCLDNYFIHTKREILVMDEWPEYIVIREHALNHWQSQNVMKFFDDEESARNYFNGGRYGE